MKRTVIIALAAISLTACQDRAEPEARFDKASRPAQVAQNGSCSPLPAGVTIGTGFSLRSDAFYVNKHNLVRRRVAYQVLEGDMLAAKASLIGSMESAGFRLLDSRDATKQRVHLRFQKKNYGIAHVVLDTIPNSDADTPVRGTLTFDLPPPSFNAAPAVKRAATR